MKEEIKISLSEKEKREFTEALASELFVLRATAGVSQDEIAGFIGVSRQTYGSIERGARRMSWGTFLSIVLFYDYNEKTHNMLRKSKGFPQKLIRSFNGNKLNEQIQIGDLFEKNLKNLWDTLDDKAVSTIKTVLMVEYARCNNLPGEEVVKFFEGINFSDNNVTEKQRATVKAIRNIKGKNNNG